MIEEIGYVVAAGFIAGTVTGTLVFLINWSLSAVMNIVQISTKGD